MKVSIATIRKLVREAVEEQTAEDPAAPTPVDASNYTAGGSDSRPTSGGSPGRTASRIVRGDYSPEVQAALAADEARRRAVANESFNRKLKRMVREAVEECMGGSRGMEEAVEEAAVTKMVKEMVKDAIKEEGELPTGAAARPTRTPPAVSGESMPGGRAFAPGGRPGGVARQGGSTYVAPASNVMGTEQTPVTTEAAIRRMVRKMVQEALRGHNRRSR